MDGTRNHWVQKCLEKSLVHESQKPFVRSGFCDFALIKQLNFQAEKNCFSFCSEKSDLFCWVYQSFSLQLTLTNVGQTFCFVMTFEASKANPEFNNQKTVQTLVSDVKSWSKVLKVTESSDEPPFLPPPNHVRFFSHPKLSGFLRDSFEDFSFRLKTFIWQKLWPQNVRD